MDYDLEQQILEQRLKQAAALRAGANRPSGQMVGGIYVNDWGGIANNVADKYIAGRDQQSAEEGLRSLGDQQSTEFNRLNQELMTPGTRTVQPYGNVQPLTPDQAGPELPESVRNMSTEVPMTPLEENQRRMGIAGQMYALPRARGMAGMYINQAAAFPEKMAAKEADIQAKKEAAYAAAVEKGEQRARDLVEQERRDRETREARERADALYRTTAAQAQQNFALTQARLAQSDADRAAQAAQNAADRKAEREARDADKKDAVDQKAAEKKAAAADAIDDSNDKLSGTIKTARDAIDKLDELGALTSSKNTGVTNLVRSVANTGTGQIAGKMFGTEAQQYRDIFNATRLNLITSLRQSKGLSAQEVNTRNEMAMRLSAMGDVSMSKEATTKLLDEAERLLTRGGGGGDKPAPTTKKIGNDTYEKRGGQWFKL
jgi:chemotaxis protein histidine kinase CheA